MRQTGRRRSVRRGVALECCVHSAYWDGPVTFVASDLSNEGMWLEAAVVLEPGDEVVLSFVPPGADAPLWTAARVVRVGGRDGQPSGMGLRLLFASATDHALLARHLEGVPPRIRGPRIPPALPSCRAPEPHLAQLHPQA